MSTPSLGTIRAKAPDPTGLPLEALTIEQIGAATRVHLAKASANSTILRDSLQAKDKAQAEAFWANEREGGAVGSGLEALSDKYASTRGDH
ncbi:hypothetical protein P7C70_g6044, partial [Phenoliferia sp. Uapishka_3]